MPLSSGKLTVQMDVGGTPLQGHWPAKALPLVWQTLPTRQQKTSYLNRLNSKLAGAQPCTKYLPHSEFSN